MDCNSHQLIERMLVELLAPEKKKSVVDALRKKHSKQSNATVEDAYMEAIEFFWAHPEKIKDESIEGLVIVRAGWKLKNGWRREKKFAQLDHKCDKSLMGWLRVDDSIDVESLLASLPIEKRAIIQMWMDGFSYREIGGRLGIENNSGLRMRIFRIIRESLR